MIVQLEGSIAQGSPIDTASAGELVAIPADLMAAGDLVFRASTDLAALGISDGEYLIVEPRRRGRAKTGELVIALVRGIAFIGRWWMKKGRRAVMDEKMSALAEGKEVRVFGAITLIVRPAPRQMKTPGHRHSALNRSRQPTHGTYCTVVPRFKRPAIDRGSLGSRHTHGGGAFLYHFISHGSGDRGIGFQGFFTYL